MNKNDAIKPYAITAKVNGVPHEMVMLSDALKAMDEYTDNFSISFAIWALYNEQAQMYLASGVTAYQLLELYKDRPFINTDPSKQ